jgi:uncharacterized iron-regulated protein
VRPHLEFACAVWDPFTTTDIQRLEMIQHRAARFVTKNYSRAKGSMTQILNQLNWPTLEQRRKQSRLITMFKIQNDLIAIPIPDYIQRQTIRSTRQYHPAKFRVMKANNNVYKHSFYPRTILDWNDLPPNVLDVTSIECFKAAISDSITT